MATLVEWVFANAQDISVTTGAILIAIAIYRESIVPGWKFRRLQEKYDALEAEARASDAQLTRLTGAVDRLERSLDARDIRVTAGDRRGMATDA